MPRLCKESCQVVFFQQHLCHKVFVAAAGSSAFLAQFKKFDAVHTDVTDFQCDGLPSVARDNESCYTLHLGRWPTCYNNVLSVAFFS